MNQNHIIKLDKCSDRQPTCLIVITVKKDQTVKLALEDNQKNHPQKQIPNAQH